MSPNVMSRLGISELIVKFTPPAFIKVIIKHIEATIIKPEDISTIHFCKKYDFFTAGNTNNTAGINGNTIKNVTQCIDLLPRFVFCILKISKNSLYFTRHVFKKQFQLKFIVDYFESVCRLPSTVYRLLLKKRQNSNPNAYISSNVQVIFARFLRRMGNYWFGINVFC